MIQGLALDIDDTLADTARHTFQLAKQVFPHDLTVDELLFKYRQPGEVPEWQTPEVTQWLEQHLGNAEYLNEMPVMSGAQPVVKRLSQKIPITCYITSRQHYTREMTLDWLARHEFPLAPLITRSADVIAKNWKFAELKKNFTQSVCLIDDGLGKLTDEMFVDEPSLLMWFNPLGVPSNNHKVTSYASWSEIEKNFSS